MIKKFYALLVVIGLLLLGLLSTSSPASAAPEVAHPTVSWLEGVGAGGTPATAFVNGPQVIWDGTSCYPTVRWLQIDTYSVTQEQHSDYEAMIHRGTLSGSSQDGEFHPTWTFQELPICPPESTSASSTAEPTESSSSTASNSSSSVPSSSSWPTSSSGSPTTSSPLPSSDSSTPPSSSSSASSSTQPSSSSSPGTTSPSSSASSSATGSTTSSNSATSTGGTPSSTSSSTGVSTSGPCLIPTMPVDSTSPFVAGSSNPNYPYPCHCTFTTSGPYSGSCNTGPGTIPGQPGSSTTPQSTSGKSRVTLSGTSSTEIGGLRQASSSGSATASTSVSVKHSLRHLAVIVPTSGGTTAGEISPAAQTGVLVTSLASTGVSSSMAGIAVIGLTILVFGIGTLIVTAIIGRRNTKIRLAKLNVNPREH